MASRKWCDFVVYSNNEESVERIAFDEKFWMSMTPTLKDFYIRGLVPILVKNTQLIYIHVIVTCIS